MLMNIINHLRKKNRKSVKQPEIITYQSNNFKNLNIADIKSVITEHAKTSHKLCKTTRNSEKVGSNSSLYSDPKMTRTFFERKKKFKITKREHAFKGYASTYNVKAYGIFSIFYSR